MKMNQEQRRQQPKAALKMIICLSLTLQANGVWKGTLTIEGTSFETA